MKSKSGRLDKKTTSDIEKEASVRKNVDTIENQKFLSETLNTNHRPSTLK
jgi:hypothetical protein